MATYEQHFTERCDTYRIIELRVEIRIISSYPALRLCKHKQSMPLTMFTLTEITSFQNKSTHLSQSIPSADTILYIKKGNKWKHLSSKYALRKSNFLSAFERYVHMCQCTTNSCFSSGSPTSFETCEGNLIKRWWNLNNRGESHFSRCFPTTLFF